MPTLRSQTASMSEKGNDMSGSAETAASNIAGPILLGPATPTQDHEFARVAVTPVIRRSRRLNVDAASVATPALPRQKPEGRGKSGGKRKAEESLQEEASMITLSAAASTIVSQDLSQVNLYASCGLSFHQAGSSERGGSMGCETFASDGNGVDDHLAGSVRVNVSTPSSTLDGVVSEHDIVVQVEVGEVSTRLDFNSAADGDVASMGEHQENHQDLASEPLHGPQVEVGLPNGGRSMRNRAEAARSRFLQIARNRAHHFAHFDADGNEAPAGAPPPRAGRRRGRQPGHADDLAPQPQLQPQQVDWPGPFSTARQLVNNRAIAAAARQNADAPVGKVSAVEWQPTRVPGDATFCRRKCPSLQDLCLGVLANNAEDVVSLEGVPDLLRIRISAAICERRKMTSKVLSLFFQGEPSEVHSLDCTQVCEDELVQMMKLASPGRLEKLHLGYCGRALSERCLSSTIASPSTTTLLKSILLKGAYRLSDQGLEALLQVSPQLLHLDLSNCSFLTNASVGAVARCVGQTLESLVLDGCPNLNATIFLHDIVQLKKLQRISLAEVGGITDEVVSELCVQSGSNLKELVLARCYSLTDAAIAAIGSCCPSLQSLNLAYLPMLTDVAIAHIADNVRNLQGLNVKRCKFSDEAIAAFLTASGGSLLNLNLNCVQQVADQTIMALAKHSHASLETLDLSFCRLVDDECLGLLADSCLQLQELRLYGCTQVTQKFLNGHSNCNLKVIGLAYSV